MMTISCVRRRRRHHRRLSSTVDCCVGGGQTGRIFSIRVLDWPATVLSWRSYRSYNELMDLILSTEDAHVLQPASVSRFEYRDIRN